MKNKLAKIATISTIFAFGIGFLSNQFRKEEPLFAEQHSENYAAYTYSGNYYSSISSNLSEGLQGNLRKALGSLILPKAYYTYSGSTAGKLGKVLQDADEDPTNPNNMVLFYTRDSVTKRGSGDGSGNWNREHVWPQSLSNGHWGKSEAGTDILHIRPTWYDTNNRRGNIVYGDLGGVGRQTYQGMVYGYTNDYRFEPIDAVKGDVARIIMYVWTAYYDHYNDSSLMITKTIESYDTLLKWHTLDKPDALEGHRNDFSESSVQKNRNPFVDHPEYAWKIFGDSCSQEVKDGCKEAYPVTNEKPNIGATSSSSEQSVQSETNETSSIPAVNEKRGCFGSLIVVPVVSISAISGLIVIFSKRKKK